MIHIGIILETETVAAGNNIMIGTKLYKNEITIDDYATAIGWCNHNSATLQDLGSYYEIVAIPGQTLEELKNKKLQEIQVWTEQHIVGGFSYNNVLYDSDIDTQITMQGIALNVHTDQFAEKYPTGCPVRGYDSGSDTKTIHMLNANQVLEFCASLSIHIGETKKIGWVLQNQVAEASSEEELSAIQWPDL